MGQGDCEAGGSAGSRRYKIPSCCRHRLSCHQKTLLMRFLQQGCYYSSRSWQLRVVDTSVFILKELLAQFNSRAAWFDGQTALLRKFFPEHKLSSCILPSVYFVHVCSSDLLYGILPLEWGDAVGRPDSRLLPTRNCCSAAQYEMVQGWWWRQTMLPFHHPHTAPGHL